MPIHAVSLLLLPFLLLACSSEGDVPENCSSNQVSNVDEGERMEPGGNCITCHGDEGEGPRYTIAGTVMGATNDDDRCVGVDGITVEITGADGKITSLTTNSVGNFFYSGSVATPYTAKIVTTNGERAMSTPQTDLNCANCHTAEGASGAPGRITPE